MGRRRDRPERAAPGQPPATGHAGRAPLAALPSPVDEGALVGLAPPWPAAGGAPRVPWRELPGWCAPGLSRDPTQVLCMRLLLVTHGPSQRRAGVLLPPQRSPLSWLERQSPSGGLSHVHWPRLLGAYHMNPGVWLMQQSCQANIEKFFA